jgi:hypothetical protein
MRKAMTQPSVGPFGEPLLLGAVAFVHGDEDRRPPGFSTRRISCSTAGIESSGKSSSAEFQPEDSFIASCIEEPQREAAGRVFAGIGKRIVDVTDPL